MFHLLALSVAFVFNLKSRYFGLLICRYVFLADIEMLFFKFYALCIQVYIQSENSDTYMHTIQEYQIVWSCHKRYIKIFLCLNHRMEFPILTQSYCPEILCPMRGLQHWQKLYHMLYFSQNTKLLSAMNITIKISLFNRNFLTLLFCMG